MRRNSLVTCQRQLCFERLDSRIVFDSSLVFESLDPLRPQMLLGHHDDGTLRFDQRGLAYHYDGALVLDDAVPNRMQNDQVWSDASRTLVELLPLQPASSSGSVGSVGGGIGNASPPAGLVVPLYHSNPNFSKKIYLDFDGELVTGTAWNNQNYGENFNTGNIIHAPAFSTDADLKTFNASELATIQEVWARVSEDFAPFQVDVTTEYPGAGAFTAGGEAIRVIISTDTDATTGQIWFPPAGGVAYLESWYWTDGSPVWAFSNNLGGGFPKYIAEAVSHEVGHAFGLGHDGRNPSEGYYQGHGQGATGWAPIMGVGYYRSLSQWSQGEYTSANNQEDDLNVISLGAGLVVDDHGDNPASATQLAVGTGGGVASSGMIASRSDKDAFRFATQSGSVTINVNPFDFSTGKNNLDVQLTLIDSLGQTIATANETSMVNGVLATSLSKGYYTVVVDGVGKSAVLGDEGYSDYGSLGKFALSGTVVPNQAPIAGSDSSRTLVGFSTLIDVLANDTDPELDTISLQSVGAPSVGAIMIEAGKVRYQPPAGYIGSATFSYIVADQFGATATGQATVNVVVGVARRGVFYNEATGSDASNSSVTDKLPLLPGQTSNFSNYTNYSRGLNGVEFDVAGLPSSTTSSQMSASLQLAHWNGIASGGFAVLPVAAVPSVLVLNNGGIHGTARIRITFPSNTLQNTWLRVTVLANASTGLAGNDVFYFGNVIGDVGIGNTNTRLRVNGQDVALLLANQSPANDSASVSNIFDLDRNGRVNGQDVAILLASQRPGGIVAPLTAPSSSPPPIAPANGGSVPVPLLFAKQPEVALNGQNRNEIPKPNSREAGAQSHWPIGFVAHNFRNSPPEKPITPKSQAVLAQEARFGIELFYDYFESFKKLLITEN